jgi:hypothetical protein
MDNNIIEYIGKNHFLKELFPNGFEEPVLLGKIELQMDDRVVLYIHIRQKPYKEISKWGIWGKNYNTIVVELLGQFVKKIDIVNWQNVQFCIPKISNKDGIINLAFQGKYHIQKLDFFIDIQLESLTFQTCRRYICESEIATKSCDFCPVRTD